MVVDPDDGSLTVHVKEQPTHGSGSTRQVMFLAVLSLVGMIIACTAFVVAMLVLRGEQRSSDRRDDAADLRDERATLEREAMARELQRIRAAADVALGQQQCRSLALAEQNAVEADADVIALELLAEVVRQSARASNGGEPDFGKLGRLEREARDHITAERVANADYRAALENCAGG